MPKSTQLWMETMVATMTITNKPLEERARRSKSGSSLVQFTTRGPKRLKKQEKWRPNSSKTYSSDKTQFVRGLPPLSKITLCELGSALRSWLSKACKRLSTFTTKSCDTKRPSTTKCLSRTRPAPPICFKSAVKSSLTSVTRPNLSLNWSRLEQLMYLI